MKLVRWSLCLSMALVALWIGYYLHYSHSSKNLPDDPLMESSSDIAKKIESTISTASVSITPGQPVVMMPLYSNEENELRRVDISWSHFKRIHKEGLRSAKDPLRVDSNVVKSFIICAANNSFSSATTKCDEKWGLKLITNWKKQISSKGLCEDGAPSRIVCYDSTVAASDIADVSDSTNNRLCIFENVMMNFKRSRRTVKSDGTIHRQWERGFLSAECGYNAEDNIGPHLQIYKHDIDGSDDAVCNYYFNETVLGYSHDNIKSFSHVMSDYLNVWTALWVSGMTQYTKDITFLNIDGLYKGHVYDDQPNHYFAHYDATFRRVIKAADFGPNSKVCFKKLILQPRPNVPYIREGWWQPLECGVSSLLQKWNLHIRHQYDLLRESEISTNKQVQVLVITRPMKENLNDVATNSRVFRNIEEIKRAVEATVAPSVRVVVQDLNVLSFKEQVRLISQSSVIIGMHGARLAMMSHMSIGSKYCCAVIEIVPAGDFTRIKGYENLAAQLGIAYNRLELSEANTYQVSSSTTTSDIGSTVPTDSLSSILQQALLQLTAKPSCIMSEVLQKIFA